MSNKSKTTTTKEEARPALVPKLRFLEFRGAGEWKTETLGSVAKISSEKVGNNTCIPMSITSGVGLVSQMEKFGRIIAGSSYTNYLLLKKNDFAYNKSATKEYPEGFIALYSGDELAAVPNSIFSCFRIKGDSPVPQYLNYLLLGNLHGRWLRNFIEVGARAHGSLSIDEDDLLALPVPLPNGKTSLREQQKIAECLSSVDELIAAQARKLGALKTHKKGLMQQLFPREDETQPRLRFPEFNGEWNDVTLGELCFNVSSGKDARESDGAFDLYGSTGVIGKTATASYDTPHILVARVGANAGYLTKASGQFGVTDNTLVIRLKPAATIDYIFHYLGNININKLIFGSGQPLITGSILKAQRVLVPAASEQSKISTCLSSIEDLINAESDKLDTLKAHKKGLMQQLFPSIEGVEG
jgi:type I restriction enzyme S subunit